jgi:signal transduction histidine kinase
VKKLALLFLLAVLLPSGVLAWLAYRSLRDQELALERQQELLFQATADNLAERVRGFLLDRQREFASEVDQLVNREGSESAARTFYEKLRASWPLAEVGFAVSLTGQLFSPGSSGEAATRDFLREQSRFLTNAETAEVYPQSLLNAGPVSRTKSLEESAKDQIPAARSESPQSAAGAKAAPARPAQEKQSTSEMPRRKSADLPATGKSETSREQAPSRVVPRAVQPEKELREAAPSVSEVVPAAAEFRQLVGDDISGSIARFVQNKLSVIFWHRVTSESQIIFGAQLNLGRLGQELGDLVVAEPGLYDAVVLALLDETGRPMATSPSAGVINWKRPFVATEIGEGLPHWEIGVYLRNPGQLNQIAASLRQTLTLMIGVMLFAIAVGGWLIFRDIGRQMRAARQKTDFVSNVSHELKTPLTSIRMFSELLAEGRVDDREKQRHYSQIIATEASRLTRLINNVLNFARMERGEKRYELRRLNLNQLVEETIAQYQPHLESNGFLLECTFSPDNLEVWVDRDAISQVLLNLLSNAEKYGGESKQISISTARQTTDTVRLSVCDRGPGVPAGCEEKIFRQFYRTHESLNSGIQGAGLGLTLARQIVRAHGGEVGYQPRPGGGSCFAVDLPLPGAQT